MDRFWGGANAFGPPHKFVEGSCSQPPLWHHSLDDNLIRLSCYKVKFAGINVVIAAHRCLVQSLTWVGSMHGSVGLGRVGSICVGLCGSPWIIQNVTLSVIYYCKVYTSELLLVLLKLFSV